MSVLLDTTDLGEAEQVISAHYTQTSLSAAPDQLTRTRMVRSPLGPLNVDELRHSFDLSFNSDPMDGIALVRVRSGAITHRHPGQDGVVARAGTVTAVSTGETQFSGQVHEAHFDSILIPEPLFDSLASGPPTRGEARPIRFLKGMPTSAAANTQLVSVIDHVTRNVVVNAEAARSPLVAGGVARYLAASMLAAFPNTAVLEPTIEDRNDTTPVLLRRAVSYIDDNAHNEIYLADIARHVYVTPRALQLMFRKHRDCTPMEYVRRVRLHHAHLELVAANRTRTTVAQIAARWGFHHLGRFAVYYRAHYGQSPHVTLRS